jgi:hypothetical protein
MRQKPSGLALELLSELATAVSKQGLWLQRGGLAGALRGLLGHALDLYGRQRWPVSHLKLWLWRRRSGLDGKQHSLDSDGR